MVQWSERRADDKEVTDLTSFSWNDTHTHASVTKYYDLVLAKVW